MSSAHPTQARVEVAGYRHLPLREALAKMREDEARLNLVSGDMLEFHESGEKTPVITGELEWDTPGKTRGVSPENEPTFARGIFTSPKSMLIAAGALGVGYLAGRWWINSKRAKPVLKGKSIAATVAGESSPYAGLARLTGARYAEVPAWAVT